MSDSHLNQRRFAEFLAGSRDADKYYYTFYFQAIYYFLRKIVGSPAVAKDQTQETFLKLFEKRLTILNESHLGGFLYTTAANLAQEYMREHGRLEELKDYLAYVSDQQTTELEVPSRAQKEGEILMALRMEFRGLSARKRRILVLYFFHGRTSMAIAKQLGISRQTVLNHLSQSIILLRRGLDGRWEEISPNFS